jgi:hypothetical protein
MGSAAVMDLLKKKTDTIAEARAKTEKLRTELAEQTREIMPEMPREAKPRDLPRMRRHLSDIERLLGRANRELDDLGQR